MLVKHLIDEFLKIEVGRKNIIHNPEQYLPYYDDLCESPSNYEGIQFLGSYCVEPHIDHDFPRYTHHLVVINTGLIALGVNQGLYESQVQEPGHIVCIDTHRSHHLVEDPRIGSLDNVNKFWISAYFELDTILGDDAITHKFREFILEFT
jgi:hypothetical protein